ncbi:MAG: SPOR domain-containing protein, partial [Pseudomonadota bacterium]|nr:SPOR domain-containing protein [Pseudomonadota bacterium]
RDAHAEELLEAAFNTLEQRQDSRLFAGLTIPRLNPVREQAIIAREFAALGVAAPTEMGSAQPAPALRVVLADEDEMASPLPAFNDAPAAPAANAIWSIQVGAYRTADQARARLSEVADLSPVLAQAQHAARAVDINGTQLWRARFEALSAEDARRACSDFGAADEACYAVAPGR